MTEAPENFPRPRRTMSRRAWILAAIAAAVLVAAVIAIIVFVASQSRSLESVAAGCGGESAGVLVDETGLLVDLSRGTDTLICVLPGILPDKADQYAVTLMLDEGESRSITLDGREVRVGELGGSQFVFFKDR